MKLKPLIDGAPNFRKIDGLPVYGVAIPTVLGLRNVLSQLGITAKNGRRLVWVNLREEPLIYVNGSPYVVRESDKPFANLEYSGIDAARVVEMEEERELVTREAAVRAEETAAAEREVAAWVAVEMVVVWVEARKEAVRAAPRCVPSRARSGRSSHRAGPGRTTLTSTHSPDGRAAAASNLDSCTEAEGGSVDGALLGMDKAWCSRCQ